MLCRAVYSESVSRLAVVGRLAATAILLSLLPGVQSWTSAAQHPLEPADTSSPRATLQSFVEAWSDLYQEVITEGEFAEFTARRVISCLDLSEVAPALRLGVAGESAVCLKEVLDRLELPPWEEVPGAEQLTPDGDAQPLQHWRIPGTEITLSRVSQGPREGEYLFDPDTVDRASEFFFLVRDQPYQSNDTPGIYEWYLSDAGGWIPDKWVHALPRWTRRMVLGTPIWKWFGLCLMLIVLLGSMFLIYRAGRRMAKHFRETSVIGYFFSLLFPIAAIAMPALARYVVGRQLSLRGDVFYMVTIFLDVTILLAVIIVVLGIGSRIAELIISNPRIQPTGLDAQFIRVACRLASLVAAIFVFLEGGKQLGIPLTTLLAGAGVGGLALALAAQDALKNVFGSMMIFLDKPYRVGERIVTKGYDGVVEEIGLRSTKIRLLTGHQASIPNEDMARSHIENIGRRPHIRRATDIALELNTPPDKVERAVEIIRGLLADREELDPNFPPRVFFDEFNRDSLRVRIIYWYRPPNYWDFVAFSEKLNLRIMQELQAADIHLALPTTVTHMSIDEKDLADSGGTGEEAS